MLFVHEGEEPARQRCLLLGIVASVAKRHSESSYSLDGVTSWGVMYRSTPVFRHAS
jgi:hypothetical protein